MVRRVVLDRMGACALPFVRRIPGVTVSIVAYDPARDETTVDVEFPDDLTLRNTFVKQLDRC